ncbi:MAG: hypothetical protein LAP85_23535 [Acidobacteriia bacterium]|nr:hypothetical protein [Terriglobia bacterium]
MAPVTEVPVEGPSDIITCEEIYERLWRYGTVIEFEHGANSAGKQLCATTFATPQPPHGSWNQE